MSREATDKVLGLAALEQAEYHAAASRKALDDFQIEPSAESLAKVQAAMDKLPAASSPAAGRNSEGAVRKGSQAASSVQPPVSLTVPLGEAGPHSSDADAVGAPASEGPREQIPTLPGKVGGIVGWDPLVLQCRECGSTWTNPYDRAAAGIILSGYHFHRHSETEGRRLCPDCLTAERAACETCQRVGTR